MRPRVVESYTVPMAAARAAVMEIQIVERGPPRRWRLRIALWLIKLAGKLSRMRVRVVKDVERPL